MRILRIGSTHGSPLRYLDILNNKDIDHITWVTHENDLMVKKVFEKCQELEPNFSKKFTLVTFKMTVVANFWIRVLNFLASKKIKLPGFLEKFLILITNVVFYLTTSQIYRKVLTESKYDFVWSGNNDSDGVNYSVWALSIVSPINIVHSYQEHRCSYRVDEKVAICAAHHLILPSERNLQSFNTTYNVDLQYKTSFGNEDWRSQYLMNKISKIAAVNHHSSNEPSVIILARFATYGRNGSRRGSRINYVDVMEELASRGIHVHLNCLKIVDDIDTMNYQEGNPYDCLKDKYPTFIHIDSALDLNDFNSYGSLKGYTAGLLHNYVEDEDINAFSEMNVPNRLFEYLISDVPSVLKLSTLKDAEDLIKSMDFGILYQDYDELEEKLRNMNTTKAPLEKKMKYSFGSFVDIIMLSHS
ncbi:hypothetical protein L4D20_16945 [Vibrio kyushuensis]|uniref:hypothetical protein n=1 Tax=Vibrio kyushuensis TaxID=2910249 RepID=UPI003D142C6D